MNVLYIATHNCSWITLVSICHHKLLFTTVILTVGANTRGIEVVKCALLPINFTFHSLFFVFDFRGRPHPVP